MANKNHDKKSEFYSFFENVPSGFVRLDARGRIVWANSIICNRLGYKREELLNKSVATIITSKSRDIFNERMLRVFEEKKILESALYEIRTRAGKKLLAEVSSVPIVRRGKIVGLNVLAHDVTKAVKQRKITELLYSIASSVNEVSDLEELFKKIRLYLNEIFDTENILIALYDSKKDDLKTIYKVSTKEKYRRFPLGQTLTAWVIRNNKSVLLKGDELDIFIKENKIKTIGTLCKVWLGVPLRRKHRVVGVITLQSFDSEDCFDEEDLGVLEKISPQIATAVEHKDLEDELTRRDAQYRSLLKQLPVGIYRSTKSGRFLFANEACISILGVGSPEELYKRRVQDFYVNPAQRERELDLLEEEMENILHHELQLRTAKGVEIWVRDTARAFYDEGLGEICYDGIIEDITEERRARLFVEVALEISKSAIQSIDIKDFFRNVHNILKILITAENFYIALYDPETDIVEFPYFADEYDSHPPPDKLDRYALTSRLIREGKPIHFKGSDFEKMTKAGKFGYEFSLPNDLLGVPIVSKNEVIGVMVVQSYDENISYDVKEIDALKLVSSYVAIAIERFRYESLLALQGEILKSAVNSIMLTDKEGKIIWVNPAFTRNSGYSKEEILGKNPRILNSGRQDENFYKNLWQTILNKKPWHGQVVNKRKDGTLYTEEMTITPHLDESGEITHFISIRQDVTEKLQLQHQIQQIQKMDAMGKLAGGISHDLNNILTPILGYSDLLLGEILPDNPIYDYVEEIKEASKKAADIVQKLLIFSKKQVVKPRIIDVSQAIRGEIPTLKRLFGEDIEVYVKVPDSKAYYVEIDPVQLEQVIVNLALNSKDSMPNGGIFTIELDQVSVSNSSKGTLNLPEISPGQYFLIRFKDSGTGISKETLPHIFEPFFTTKSTSQAAGLGLSVVYGIVKQQNGHIKVSSTQGLGTIVDIYFPLIQKTGGKELAAVDIEKDVKRKKTILVAEDEEIIRKLAYNILEHFGYACVLASNGEEALKIFEDSKEKIDLILTDIVMPKMSGHTLVKYIRAMEKAIKVIFMSGYPEGYEEIKHFLDENTVYIQKPFTPHSLMLEIKKLFGEI